MTSTRLLGEAAALDLAEKDRPAAMSNFNKMLQNTDDIVINCWLGISEATDVDG